MKQADKFVKKWYLILLLSLLVLPWFMLEHVFAATETGSITIKLKDLKTTRSDVEFKIYPVGEWDAAQGNWELCSNLTYTGVILDNLNGASEWQAAAQTLSKQSVLETLAYKSGKTDANGELKVSDLAWGMYLIVQTEVGRYGTIDPFMVPIPYVTNGIQESDRMVSPKAIALSTVANAEIILSKTSYTYDGTEKKPDVTVRLDGKTLVKDTDYTVSYANNKEIGTATVTITGKGSYIGTANKTYTINAIAINTAEVTLGKTSYNYDGKAKKPNVSVKLNSKTLKKGTDYIVSYKDNKNIGKATVTIEGTGNYSGSISKTFTIKVKKGATFSYKKNKYKVTDTSTVAFKGIVSTKTTSVTIPATVTYGGQSFKVTSIEEKALKNKNKVKSVTIGTNVKTIGESAFDGCKKLKTITIKSTKLNKVGKKAFKSIHAKAEIKVPKNKLSKYKKLLKNKGQGSKVKIKK